MATFITSKSVGETISIYAETSTGYWKYNHDGTDSSVFDQNNGAQTITVANANGEFTLIPCLSDGTPSGDITLLGLGGNQLTSFDGTGLTSLNELGLGDNQLTSFDATDLTSVTNLVVSSNLLISIDVSSLTNLNILTLQNNQLTSLDITGLLNLQYLSVENNPFTNSTLTNNSLLAKLAANELANDWDTGELYTSGGRTSAGTTDYDYLIANNWEIFGADLIPTGTGKLRVKGIGQL
jgi:hypothetical protein